MPEIKKERETATLKVQGDLIFLELKNLEDDLKQILLEGMVNIILDLESTRYLSAEGIRLLITFLKEVKSKRGAIKLINVSRTLKKVFEVTGLLEFLDIYESREEALNNFNENVSDLEKKLLWNNNKI